MTIDEYRGLMAQIIADPSQAETIGGTLIDEITKDNEAHLAEMEEAKTELETANKSVKDLTDSVNKYKAKEFMGAIGKPEEKPFNPLQNAVDIAAKIINPHYGEKEKQ